MRDEPITTDLIHQRIREAMEILQPAINQLEAAGYKSNAEARNNNGCIIVNIVIYPK